MKEYEKYHLKKKYKIMQKKSQTNYFFNLNTSRIKLSYIPRKYTLFKHINSHIFPNGQPLIHADSGVKAFELKIHAVRSSTELGGWTISSTPTQYKVIGVGVSRNLPPPPVARGVVKFSLERSGLANNQLLGVL